MPRAQCVEDQVFKIVQNPCSRSPEYAVIFRAFVMLFEHKIKKLKIKDEYTYHCRDAAFASLLVEAAYLLYWPSDGTNCFFSGGCFLLLLA